MSHCEPFADNCGACGEEYPNKDLSKVSLHNWDIKICKSCANKDIFDNYKEATDLITVQNGEYIEAMNILAELKNVR